MSLLLATALVASATTLPVCSWDKPGVRPFMGDVVAAVDRYGDIPAATRARLKQRMSTRQYDEIAAIRRDSITGPSHQYGAGLRDMHFANGTVCREVTRKAWADDAVERGLVYCEGEHCLIVPTVCRNLSRVTRLPRTQIAGTNADDEVALPALNPALGLPSALPVGGELVFDPPGAGNPTGPELPSPAEATWTSSAAATPSGAVPGGGVPWPIGVLPIGGGGAPIGFARLPDAAGVVPEPATGLLLLAGGAALAASVRLRSAAR